ncbi:hypothetical protein WMY93_021861 [Mugilogobius chulae]|uniref:non-specific serine/threonine protein kinase n=1 Tax=Mugilogobius chulae TaxID=88201 RepID=A0AAW0NHL4_9GOBI
MGVQDKPLDSHNITESSVFSEQSCLTCCLGGEIQEKENIEPMYTTKVELEKVIKCQTEPKQQSMSSDEVTTSKKGSEDGNQASFSSLDLAAEQDIDRSCTPTETLKVAYPVNESLNILSTLTTTKSQHVPKEDSSPGLNVHVLSNTLVDLDGACQVEPLLRSPKFIMPSAPLSIGSSLVTQTPGSSLNGDQKETGWDLNRDSVYPNEALDCEPNSDDITDFSSESTEDLAVSTQIEVDSTADEVTQYSFTENKSIFEESRDLLNLAVIPNDHFTVCEEKRVACFTLDLFDPFLPLTAKASAARMPHKTHKSGLEAKARSKKDRPTGQSHSVQTFRKQENIHPNVEAEPQPCTFKENVSKEQETRLENKDRENVIETVESHKRKWADSTTESLTEVENEAKIDKARSDILKEKQVTKATDQATSQKKTEKAETKSPPKDKLPQNSNNEDLIKKRRLSQDKFGKLVSSLETKLTKGEPSKAVEDKTDVSATRRKAYSEVVKQKSVKPKQDLKVVQPIQAVSVSGDPQSLCLWCQFSDVLTDYTVTWRKDGAVLTEINRSAGDESRVSLTVSNASHKDLGKYHCELKNAHGRVTLDFVLTYELLSEIVVPITPKTTAAVPVEVGHEEENINCSRLMFKDNFLVEQYFGESHSASIVTQKIHFGEGMHRRAFRTTLQAGQIPLLVPGHACVLKVHNAISYGTNNNDELVQKNFNLAVEECQVQNTAREYIKAYTEVAQSFEAFGPVPEIIPIYLVHRPANDIPYATLEEELFGDL